MIRLILAAAGPSRKVARLVLFVYALLLPLRPIHADARDSSCVSAPTGTTAARRSGSPAVGWVPLKPRAGTLFRVRFSLSPAQRERIASATVAGEPIHFRSAGDSAFALAAVPIDSTNGVTLAVRCLSGDSVTLRIETDSGNYRLERLRVAPKFSTPPDSVLSIRMQREAEQAAAVSRAAHDTPRQWTSAFAKPRTSRVTSGFGGGRTFNGTVTSRHMGTDFAGAIGAPVRAVNRGIVRLTGSFYLGGNVVYIDHGEGIVTAYLHLSRQLVQVGDTVARGAVIGAVGATGRVTGPHLHLIARFGSIAVDPTSLFVQR